MCGNITEGSTKASIQAQPPTVVAKLPFLLYWPRSINLIKVRTKAPLSMGPNSNPVFSVRLQQTYLSINHRRC